MANVVLPFDGDFEALRRTLARWGWEVGERPNAPVFAQGPGVTLHAYATGKILLNGARAAEYADALRAEGIGRREAGGEGRERGPRQKAASRPPPSRPPLHPPPSTRRSEPGWLVFFDGACMPTNPGGVAAYGYQVLRDGALVHEGHGLAAPPGPGSTSNVAEFTGLVAALRWVRERWRTGDPVNVRGDSRLVVKTVKGEWNIHVLHLKALHAEATRLLRELDGRIEWVPRERNGDADRLSRVGWAEAVRTHPEWGLSAVGPDARD